MRMTDDFPLKTKNIPCFICNGEAGLGFYDRAYKNKPHIGIPEGNELFICDNCICKGLLGQWLADGLWDYLSLWSGQGIPEKYNEKALRFLEVNESEFWRTMFNHAMKLAEKGSIAELNEGISK